MIVCRRGVTLIELVVVLAILGIMATVAGLTMHTAAPLPPRDDTTAYVTRLRDSAVNSRQTVIAVFVHEDTAIAITAYPDGRVLSTVNGVERTTGRAHATP